MVFQFSCQGNTTVINFSVVHQTSSQTLSLPPRREVEEVYLWGYNQLIQPLAHLLAVILCCTLGFQVGAGSCSCCRNPESCFWLCDRRTNQMPLALLGDKQNLPPNVGCPGSAHSCSAQGQQFGWTGGCFGTEKAAAHKSCNAFSALLCGHQPSCVGHAAST